MNSYSSQSDQIDIFAQSVELDIFDTSNSAQTVDIFDTSDQEIDIFAAPAAPIDIFAASAAVQQIDIFNTTQAEPVCIWNNEVNNPVSAVAGSSCDPLSVKFDAVLQALNSEGLSGIAAVVSSAKNLYTYGVSR